MAYHNIETNETSESTEMYLLKITWLQAETSPVPVPLLAQELDLSPVSVNEMCRKLVNGGLVAYEPYKGVTLTLAGERLAQTVLRRRRLWEVFFVEKLGLDPLEADAIACRFEHVTPDVLTQGLADFLDYPKFSPQHEPISYDDESETQEQPGQLQSSKGQKKFGEDDEGD